MTPHASVSDWLSAGLQGRGVKYRTERGPSAIARKLDKRQERLPLALGQTSSIHHGEKWALGHLRRISPTFTFRGRATAAYGGYPPSLIYSVPSLPYSASVSIRAPRGRPSEQLSEGREAGWAITDSNRPLQEMLWLYPSSYVKTFTFFPRFDAIELLG